ncbi:MAG: competence type IV pilus major pilin ComGC [Kiritimatiellia bacterium]
MTERSVLKHKNKNKNTEKQMKNLKKQGFNMVEIMIFVIIIGLLAAIALPSFQRARNEAREKSCINNLRLIEGAKDQYAIENNLATGAAVTDTEIDAYIKGGAPTCPAAGTYTYGVVDTAPTCSANAADTHEVNGAL